MAFCWGFQVFFWTTSGLAVRPHSPPPGYAPERATHYVDEPLSRGGGASSQGRLDRLDRLDRLHMFLPCSLQLSGVLRHSSGFCIAGAREDIKGSGWVCSAWILQTWMNLSCCVARFFVFLHFLFPILIPKYDSRLPMLLAWLFWRHRWLPH